MDWFYHAPGQGRVGPLSADELHARYRDRRIQRDTLVWRDGLREWQPLERLMVDLGLHDVVQDTRLPPPLPAAMPIAMAPLGAAAGGPSARPGGPPRGGARSAPAPKRMHGCLIALLVVLGLSVPMIAILAAIALPEYQKYTVRAKVLTALEPRASALRLGTERGRAALGRCPEDAGEAGVMDQADARGLRVGTLDDGRCAFEITVTGVDPKVDGRTVLHVAPAAPGGDWDCTGGDLPAPFRPAACRGTAPETP